MDTLMFGGVGLLFTIFGLFFMKKHRDFIANCIKVDGTVIDIVDKTYITRNISGQVTKQRSYKVPLVQYRYKKLYQFQADVDVSTHKLARDTRVEVMINPFKPKTAKLTIGAQESMIAFRIMIVVGVFSIIIGAVQFNPREFNLDFLYNPLTLAIITFSIIFLYLKLGPILSILPNTPIYTENAVEVENQEKI